MKRREVYVLTCALLLALSLSAVAAQQVPRTISGTLSGNDLNWSGEIHVTGTITVPNGSTLKIAAGTIVKFMKLANTLPWELIIHGTVDARGTVAQPITFTSGSTSKSPGDWRGITLHSTSTVVGSLTHLLIEYADVNLTVRCNGVTIENCTIRNAYGVQSIPNPQNHHVRTGLFLTGENITVKDCTITNCTWGIHINQSVNNRRPPGALSVIVDDCTVSGNKMTCPKFDVPNGIHIYKSNAVIKNNTLENNTWGIEVGASNVTISANKLITNGFGIVIYWLDGVSMGSAQGNKPTPLTDPNAYSRVSKSSAGPQPIPEANLFKVPPSQAGGAASVMGKGASKVTVD